MPIKTPKTKTASPEPTSFDVHELVRRTGVEPRTLRRYVQRGLVPAPDLAGRNTRYGREHLVRLLALRKLSERTVRMEALREELNKRSFEELEVLAGLAPSKPMPVATPTPSPTPMPALSDAERWLRVPLLPGLELMVREGAPEVIARAADEIRRRYGAAR